MYNLGNFVVDIDHLNTEKKKKKKKNHCCKTFAKKYKVYEKINGNLKSKIDVLLNYFAALCENVSSNICGQ